MGNRCYLIAVLLMILAPLTLASAEPVDRSYGESNSAFSPSPFRSRHDAYIPFDLRQGLDAHYVRLSVVTENTIADHEGLQPGAIFSLCKNRMAAGHNFLTTSRTRIPQARPYSRCARRALLRRMLHCVAV